MEDNKMSYDQWMKQAKEFACRHFEYNLKEDHEFWDLLKSYWDLNMDPGQAVRNAVIDYGNELKI